MIKPLHKNCLIEIEEMKEKSGIILPDNNIITEIAKVIAIGEDVKKVKKGNRILFKSWSIDEVEIKKKKHIFISEDLILAYETT